MVTKQRPTMADWTRKMTQIFINKCQAQFSMKGPLWVSFKETQLKTGRMITSKLKFWRTDGIIETAKSLKYFMSITTTLFAQVADSVLDAAYFVQLQRKPRLVHVPAWVHGVQGMLLYTCELQSI